MRRFVLIVALLVIVGGIFAMAHSSTDAWARNARGYKQRHHDRAVVAQAQSAVKRQVIIEKGPLVQSGPEVGGRST
jgi:hypothetical protein